MGEKAGGVRGGWKEKANPSQRGSRDYLEWAFGRTSETLRVVPPFQMNSCSPYLEIPERQL